MNKDAAKQQHTLLSRLWEQWFSLQDALLYFAYAIGVQTLRAMVRVRLGLRLCERAGRAALYAVLDRLTYYAKLMVVANSRVEEAYREYTALLTEEVGGKKTLGMRLRHLGALLWRGLCASLARHTPVRHYLIPACAGVVFFIVVQVVSGLNYALRVEYNGQSIGYIDNEAVFERAEKQMQGRIVFEEYIRPANTVPTFSLAVVPDERISGVNQLTNALIQASGNELDSAYGLYVDDEFFGAAQDVRDINALLTSILDAYRSGAPDEQVAFIQNVDVREGLYPLSSIVGVRRLRELLLTQKQERTTYTVKAGDAPLSIAARFDLRYAEFKALNPNVEKRLMPGDEVLISRAVPTLGVKLIRTEISERDIAFDVQQVSDTTRVQGYVQITQRGRVGIEEVTSEVTYVDGIESDRRVISTRRVREPTTEYVVVGGKEPVNQVRRAVSDAGYIWPVDGERTRVTCHINGYPGHTGMDIGGMGYGGAIRAARAGTVVKVVYSYVGYGFHVIIDHGGGVQTLYAHNSKIYVKVGQWVEQGQLIAAAGRTGNSSGVHLHFEVRVNGQYKNPANYIGTRG